MKKMIKICTIIFAVLFLIILFIFKSENIKAKDDFNHINHGMSSDKVIEILGEPAQKTTNLSEIKEATSHTYYTLKDYFIAHDEEFVESLEDTPSNRMAIKRWEEFKTIFSNLILTREYIEQRKNLEMFSYTYKDPEDNEYYVHDIVFYDDTVIYFYIFD